MRRIFLACLACLFAVAAMALAWVPVHSAPAAGLAFQEPLPPEGWTVCEVGGLEYIQEVNEYRQVFKVCNDQGWEIKAFCTQPGVPAPGGGTGCSYEPGGTFWCGGSVQVLQFFAIIEEPPATETPTPTEPPVDPPTDTPAPTEPPIDPPTGTPTPTPTDNAYPVDTPTPTPTDNAYPVDTATPTPTGTVTQTDTPTLTPTNTQPGEPVVITVVTVAPPVNPGNDPRPFPGGPGNRTFVILALVAMSLTWGIAIWAFVLRRKPGRS